jgi:hypothetical protein
MKIMSKKVKVFGRSIPAVAIALIAIAALASAGLLSYYGKLVGTATVSQSVKVDGRSYTESITGAWDGSFVAGKTIVDGPHKLTNDAPVPAKIVFETLQCEGTGCTPSTTSIVGITTTYQLVTTLFGKRGGTAEWTTENPREGSYSVKMYVPAGLGGYNGGALVAIPIVPTTLNNLDSLTMSFYVKGDCAGDKPAYYQLKIDLGSDDFGRFVVLTPTSMVTSCSDWTKGSVSDSWYIWAFSGTPVGYGPHTSSEWHTILTSSGIDSKKYTDYKVVEVDVQYGWNPNTAGGTVYVDTVTFQDKTWDLEPDKLQKVELTGYPIDLYIGSDMEERDFTITNSFQINLIPDTYTITTEIKPA